MRAIPHCRVNTTAELLHCLSLKLQPIDGWEGRDAVKLNVYVCVAMYWYVLHTLQITQLMPVLLRSHAKRRACHFTSPLSFKEFRLYARVVLLALAYSTRWWMDELLCWGSVQSVHSQCNH